MSATVLEARAVITGEDRTGAMFASLERRVASLSKMSKAIGDVPRYAATASRAIETATKASHASMAAGISHSVQHGIRHALAQTALVAGPVGAAIAAVHKAVHASAEYQHEKVALTNAGRTKAEMGEIHEASLAVLKNLPGASLAENLKVINETTGAFGSLHHAIENLEFMSKAASVLQAAAGDKLHEDAGSMGNKFARFFEERQVAGDTPTFQREGEGLLRAMVATRGTFNPQEALNFAQQAKSALPNYSEHFLTKIAPSLITMLGGDRAGTAANAFNSVVTGKVNDKKQAEEWLRYGLLDPKQTVMKAGHAVGWRAGAVRETNLALSDPLEWMEKVALPAMEAKGVKIADRLELTKALATMFRNQNSNVWANDLGQEASRSRLHKDAELYGRTGTMNEIYDRNQWTDPLEAWKSAKEAATNLGAASGIMEHGVAPVLANLARGMQTVTRAFEGDHTALGETWAAKTIATLKNQLRYGAATPDGSPEGIYRKILEDAEKAQGEIMGSTLKVQGLREAVAEAEKNRNRAELTNLYARLAGAEADLAALRATAGRAAALKGTIDAVRAEQARGANRMMGVDMKGTGPAEIAPGLAMFGRGRAGMNGFAGVDYPGRPWWATARPFEGPNGIPLPPRRPTRGVMSHVSTPEEVHDALFPPDRSDSPFGGLTIGGRTIMAGGPRAAANTAAQSQQVNVSGQVTGQADVNVKVSVDAAPELKATASALQGAIVALRGRLSGDPGRSSPDAAPGAQTGAGGQ